MLQQYSTAAAVQQAVEAPAVNATHEEAPPIVLPVLNFMRQQVGEIELPADIFRQEIRRDILQRVVRWQLAKRQQGTHSTKGRGEVRGGGRKPHPQKKTGNARAGSIRSPLWRGGGTIHGPKPRSHAHKLQKRVRRMGLKAALSAKVAEERLIVLDTMSVEGGKTKTMSRYLDILLEGAPRRSILFMDSGKTAEDGGSLLRRSIMNLQWVDAIPYEGANVYSILQRDYLAMTPGAIEELVKRLRKPINR